MDKWKELELEKMQVGGNRRAREFFRSQPDYRANASLADKYNSRAAALLRDKVCACPSLGHSPAGIGVVVVCMDYVWTI